MNTINLRKKTKKLKLILKNTLISKFACNKEIIIHGPLGTVSYIFKNQPLLTENNFFIKTVDLNFFLSKIKKLIKSVSTGWFVELNLNGLGFKSFKLNDKIAFDLGYSNLIVFKPTQEIKIKNFKNKVILFSLNQDYLSNVSNHLKAYSIPDAYKGKGILFKNEKIKLKKKAKS